MPEEKKIDTVEDEGGLNPIERLALAGALEPDEPAETPAPDPAPPTPGLDLSAVNDRLTKAEERAFAAEQRNQFLAGQLAQMRDGIKPKVEELKRFVFNKDEFTEALQKDPASAIHDLIQAVASDTARGAAREVETKVDSRFGQLGASTNRERAFQVDRDKTRERFADVVDNKDFQEAANKELIDIVAMRTGKTQSAVTTADFQPGDFMSAASSAYADWARNGKLPKVTQAPAERQNRSIREIVAAVPKNDGLGTPGARSGSAGKVTLADLYSDKELPAIRKLMKEFGSTEAEWIANMQAAAREDEAYAQ